MKRHGGTLKCILLNQRSQSEKVTYSIIPTIWRSGKGKTIETVERSVVAKGVGWGEEGWTGGAQVIFRAVKLFCINL